MFNQERFRQNILSDQNIAFTLDKAVEIITHALYRYSQNINNISFDKNDNCIQLTYNNFTKVQFKINISYPFFDSNAIGWYLPKVYGDLENSRQIYINLFYLYKLSEVDLAYVLLHELIHAGILNGKTEVLDESLTDQAALYIIENAGYRVTIRSGYVQLREKLSEFGNKIDYWIKAQSELNKSTDYKNSHDFFRHQLATGIVSIVFEDDECSKTPPDYEKVVTNINKYKPLLRYVFNRLISLYNGENVVSAMDLNSLPYLDLDDSLLETIYQNLAKSYHNDQQKKQSLIQSFLEYCMNELLKNEDKLSFNKNLNSIELTQLFIDYLRSNNILYIYDFLEKQEFDSLVQDANNQFNYFINKGLHREQNLKTLKFRVMTPESLRDLNAA